MIQLSEETKQQLADVLVGTAVGDSIGLPFEGIKPKMIERLRVVRDLQHCLIGQFGMWSDDTDHAVLLTRSLLATNSDEEEFLKSFSRSLKLWFLALPPGVGLGTVRAIGKLLVGFSARKSGVFSAGNGPSMRAAAIGVIHADSEQLREKMNHLQTAMTHSDLKAEIASRAVVEVAAYLSNGQVLADLVSFKQCLLRQQDAHWESMMEQLFVSLTAKHTLKDYLLGISVDPEKGVSGYSYHTVPAVIYSCLRWDWDFSNVIRDLVAAGGDTDTACAIAGGLCSLKNGRQAIPEGWKTRIKEWPTSLNQIEHYSLNYDQGYILPGYSIVSYPLRLGRNLFQLSIVITHGLARLLPIRIKKILYRK